MSSAGNNTTTTSGSANHNTNGISSPGGTSGTSGSASSNGANAVRYVPGSGPPIPQISLLPPSAPHQRTAVILDRVTLEEPAATSGAAGSAGPGGTRLVEYYYVGWTDRPGQRGLVACGEVGGGTVRDGPLGQREVEEW